MEKVQYRSVIRYLFLKGKTPTEIKTELDAVYGEESPSFTTVKIWTADFKRGRTSVFDEERSGRPKTATNEEMIKKVYKIVNSDRRLKVHEIAEAAGISDDRVHSILHEHLGMRKLSARWVPHLLSFDQKQVRWDLSEECLDLFNRNKKEFLRRFVTVDETWVHYYTPETKVQSKQWVSPGEKAPRKAKVIPSAGKVMATIFWDAHGILLIDYLQKGRTITGAYYVELLDRLDAEIKRKRPHLAKKKVLFHQDNAPAHTSRVAKQKIQDLGYELLPHPPYSPDLGPSDFFLFPKLKSQLAGERFSSNDEIIAAVNGYFEERDKNYFTEGLSGLEKRWSKCIELEGDYVEK